MKIVQDFLDMCNTYIFPTLSMYGERMYNTDVGIIAGFCPPPPLSRRKPEFSALVWLYYEKFIIMAKWFLFSFVKILTIFQLRNMGN